MDCLKDFCLQALLSKEFQLNLLLAFARTLNYPSFSSSLLARYQDARRNYQVSANCSKGQQRPQFCAVYELSNPRGSEPQLEVVQLISNLAVITANGNNKPSF